MDIVMAIIWLLVIMLFVGGTGIILVFMIGARSEAKLEAEELEMFAPARKEEE